MFTPRFLLPILAVILQAFSLTAAFASPPPYKGAIVVDAATGNILFEDNADVVNPPASVTKLMTFLVVHDRIKAGALALDTQVPISAEDSKIGGTQVWLDPREHFSVDELLYALMIQSANDAANALARAAAGSRPAFVELMNARARALGMTHTTFRSPHGLPPAGRKLSDSDLTSPRDLALLSRELLQSTDILSYSSVKERPFGAGQRDEPVIMRTHNHLLGKVAGVDGLKTGYTAAAGFCLSATAARNNRRVVVVVMGATEAKARDLAVAELLERGFAALPPEPASPISSAASSPVGSPASPVAATTPVESGKRAAPTRPSPAPSPTPPGISFPTVKPTKPVKR